jgi:hypothetical protein
MADPRRVVRGSVWAKSTAVSRDCKRIYGADCDKIYLHGTVVEVLTHRPEGARRSTTLIKAKYKVGHGEKIQVINLAQLKKDNPNPSPAATPAPAPTTAPADTSSPQNLEQSSSTSNNVPTTSTPSVQATNMDPPPTVQTTATGTTNSTGTASTGASQVPTVSCHGIDWFSLASTDLPTNGPFTHKAWKLTCQYTGAVPWFSPIRGLSQTGFK